MLGLLLATAAHEYLRGLAVVSVLDAMFTDRLQAVVQPTSNPVPSVPLVKARYGLHMRRPTPGAAPRALTSRCTAARRPARCSSFGRCCRRRCCTCSACQARQRCRRMSACTPSLTCPWSQRRQLPHHLRPGVPSLRRPHLAYARRALRPPVEDRPHSQACVSGVHVKVRARRVTGCCLRACMRCLTARMRVRHCL
jgi:hypothetical protein